MLVVDPVDLRRRQAQRRHCSGHENEWVTTRMFAGRDIRIRPEEECEARCAAGAGRLGKIGNIDQVIGFPSAT